MQTTTAASPSSSHYSNPHIVHYQQDREFTMFPSDRPPRSRANSSYDSTTSLPPLGRKTAPIDDPDRQNNRTNNNNKNNKMQSIASRGVVVEEPQSSNTNTIASTPEKRTLHGGGDDYYTYIRHGIPHPAGGEISANPNPYFNHQSQQYEYRPYARGLPKNIGPHQQQESSFSSSLSPSPSSFNKLRNNTQRLIEDAKSNNSKRGLNNNNEENDNNDHNYTKTSNTAGYYTTKDGYQVAIPMPPRHRARSYSSSRDSPSYAENKKSHNKAQQRSESARRVGDAGEWRGTENENDDDENPVLVTTRTKTTVDPSDLSIVTTNETRIKIPSQAVNAFLMMSNGGGEQTRPQQQPNPTTTYNILLSSPASPMIMDRQTTFARDTKRQNIDPEPDEAEEAKEKDVTVPLTKGDIKNDFIASFGLPETIIPADVAQKYANASSYFPSTLKRIEPISLADEEATRFDVLHQRRVALQPYEKARHDRAHAQRELIESDKLLKLKANDANRKIKSAAAIRRRKEEAEKRNFYVAFGQPTRVYPSRIASSFPRTCHTKYEKYFADTWDSDIEDVTFFLCPQGEEPREEVRRFMPVYMRREEIQPSEEARHQRAEQNRGRFLRERQEKILDRETSHVRSVRDRGGIEAIRQEAKKYRSSQGEEETPTHDDNGDLSPTKSRGAALFSLHDTANNQAVNGIANGMRSTTASCSTSSMTTSSKTTRTIVQQPQQQDVPATTTTTTEEHSMSTSSSNTRAITTTTSTNVNDSNNNNNNNTTSREEVVDGRAPNIDRSGNGGEEEGEPTASRSPPPAPRSISAVDEDKDEGGEEQNTNSQSSAPSSRQGDPISQQRGVFLPIPELKYIGANQQNNKDNTNDIRTESINEAEDGGNKTSFIRSVSSMSTSSTSLTTTRHEEVRRTTTATSIPADEEEKAKGLQTDVADPAPPQQQQQQQQVFDSTVTGGVREKYWQPSEEAKTSANRPMSMAMPPPPISPPKSRASKRNNNNNNNSSSAAGQGQGLPSSTSSFPPRPTILMPPTAETDRVPRDAAPEHVSSSITTTCMTTTTTSTTTTTKTVNRLKPNVNNNNNNGMPIVEEGVSRSAATRRSKPVQLHDEDDEYDFYNPQEIIGNTTGENDSFHCSEGPVLRQFAIRAPSSRPPPRAFVSSFSIPKTVTPSKNAEHFPRSRAIFSRTCRPTNISGAVSADEKLRGGLDMYYNNKTNEMPLAEEEKIRFVPLKIRRLRMPEFDHFTPHDHDEVEARRQRFIQARVQKIKDRSDRHKAFLFSDEHMRQMGIIVTEIQDGPRESPANTEEEGRKIMWSFGQPRSVIPAANARDFPRSRRYFMNKNLKPIQAAPNGVNESVTSSSSLSNTPSNPRSLLSSYNKTEENVPIEAEEIIRFLPLAARRELIGSVEADRVERNAKRRDRFLKNRRASLNNKDRDRKTRAAEVRKNPNRRSAQPIDLSEEFDPATTTQKLVKGNRPMSFASTSSSSHGPKQPQEGDNNEEERRDRSRFSRRKSRDVHDDNDCLSPVSPRFLQQPQLKASLGDNMNMASAGMSSTTTTTTTTFSQTIHKTESTTSTLPSVHSHP